MGGSAHTFGTSPNPQRPHTEPESVLVLSNRKSNSIVFLVHDFHNSILKVMGFMSLAIVVISTVTFVLQTIPEFGDEDPKYPQVVAVLEATVCENSFELFCLF